MQVRALTSFSGPLGSYGPGHEFELPEGADWVHAGLVEVVEVPESSDVGQVSTEQDDNEEHPVEQTVEPAHSKSKSRK